MKTYCYLLAELLIIGLMTGCTANPGKQEPDRGAADESNQLVTSPVSAPKPAPKQRRNSVSKASSPKPDLSGFWVLNEELSDDPRNKMKEFKSEKSQGFHGRGMGGGKGSGGGMGRGGRGGRMDGGPRKGGMGSSRTAMARIVRPARSIEIKHEDPLLVIIDDQGRMRRIYTDNRGSSISVSGGMNQQVSTAGWEQDELVVETSSVKGGRFTQRYKLEADGSRLSLTTEMAMQQATKILTIRTLYDSSMDPMTVEKDSRRFLR